ncbi:MAG TPA: PaaI family thioesterase [Rhizomicrobium sp.]|nr:PaaI family thioesterase [Rhizomicrobium sp.]
MRRPVEAAHADEYPPNIQAILKRLAPASAHLGQVLQEIDTDEGWVRIGYTLSEAHFNRYGAIHGGVIACVMDDVVATAAGLVAAWGEIAPTLEMKVSYLNQATAGAHTAEARVVKRGKTVLFLEGAMFNDAGKTIATASATIMITAMKR